MIAQLFWSLIGNALALLASAYFVAGFNLNINNWQAFAALVVIFTVLNVVLKPIIRFFLGPLIVLTLGLFNLVITAGMLYVVDIYSENLTIVGLPALIAGTLSITIVNVLIQVFAHRKH
jgi:putative membrane protein